MSIKYTYLCSLASLLMSSSSLSMTFCRIWVMKMSYIAMSEIQLSFALTPSNVDLWLMIHSLSSIQSKIDMAKEGSWKCEQCLKTFSSKGSLNVHISGVHDKIRGHVCDTCGKGFSQSSHLRVHKISVHSGEKLYHC